LRIPEREIAKLKIHAAFDDTQVPVGLSPFLDVIKTGDEFVTITGTWTRFSGLSGSSSSLAFPLQNVTYRMLQIATPMHRSARIRFW
jgi:hypothetical protein